MEVAKEQENPVNKAATEMAVTPTLLIVGGDPSAQRRLEITCRSLPESVSLTLICVNTFAEAEAKVKEGNVLLAFVDESLIASAKMKDRETLFPNEPFLQAILWNGKDEALSCNMLSRSMKIASLTHEHLQKWRQSRSAGLWH